MMKSYSGLSEMSALIKHHHAKYSVYIERELRSDHAGETGAVYIYKGILAVAGLIKNQGLIQFAQHHLQTEQEHLVLIQEWIEPKNVSIFIGPWRIAGWLTGALPALFGTQAVYATIVAVETFVDQHYQQQIDYLKNMPNFSNLLNTLERCQADERRHRDEAHHRLQIKMSWPLRLWCFLVSKGSALAVSVARKC